MKREYGNTKNFRRTASQVHNTNFYTPMRGGIRL